MNAPSALASRGDAQEASGAPPARGPSGIRRLRLTRRAAVLLGLAGLVLLICLATWQILAARNHLEAGVTDLRRARGALHLGVSNGTAGVDRKTRRSVAAAAREFGAARDDLRLWSPLLARLGWVPRVGPELAFAPPAADSAWYASESALHLVRGLAPVQPALRRHSAHGQLLARLGATLQRERPQFAAASTAADDLTQALRGLPAVPGNRRLNAVRAELKGAAPMLVSASHWLAVAPLVLGFQGPRHYLILLQNPAQLAPTGGMIGALDYLTMDRGSVHNRFSSVKLPHEITTVSAPLPEAMYSPIGHWTLLDTNWSPDFPLSARIARWFYGEDTGRWPNGVIGLLDTGIVRLLGATGPVYVPEYGRWVAAGNVESLAQHYVNSGYHGPSAAGTADTVRKQFFGAVIRALTVRLQRLPSSRWEAVSGALAQAVVTREVQMYDRRPAVEAAVRSSGADGALASAPGDFLGIVDFNESDNKLNPYVHESATYRVTVRRDLWLDATLTLRYAVSPSPTDLEGLGPVFGFGGTKHDYEDYLRIFVPRGAQLLRVSGAQGWAAIPAYGLTQMGGHFIVPAGGTRTVVFHYRVPANAVGSLDTGRYALTVRRQPGTNLTALRVRIDGGNGVAIGQAGVNSISRVLSLSHDARLHVLLRGHLHPRMETLPPPSGPVDPYIPFADMHDPRHPL